MTNKKNKGFTLIELISVLVILAILALIVTPLVLNIIRKARVSADKRSIDAYGRSIELAVASYLLDNGTFPTSIEQLTIEYTGDRVECETTKLNSDSSVYLASCTVAGREVTGYTYGTDKTEQVSYTAYEVGDVITYNNVNYYIIADSEASESTVTLLKAEPLTVEQVNTYGGVGTQDNHVNMYATSATSASYYQTAYNQNGYGGMQYYSSETCIAYGDTSGCTNTYANSEIKYVVDAWKMSEAPLATEARLITIDDLKDNLGYVLDTEATSELYRKSENTPSWVYNNNYDYWTMSQKDDSTMYVWDVYSDGSLNGGNIIFNYAAVRPVITLSKSSLSS